MRRRVGAPSQISESQYSDPEVLKGLLNLADIGALAGAQAPMAPMDLMGASQEPRNFDEIAGVQQYERPQPPPEKDYLKTLRQISQLPMAMSDSDELRQDALENLDSYDRPMQAETMPEPVKNRVPLDPNDVMSQLASLPAYQRDSDFERQGFLENMQENGIPEKMQVPKNINYDASLDPNDVMSQLTSLPAYQYDSDLEREEALQGMRDQAQTTEQFPVDGLPRDEQGNLRDPLEVIRGMVEQDPSLMDQLPEETRAMLAQNNADANKPFVAPPQAMPDIQTIPQGQPITAQDVENFPQQTAIEGAVEQGMQDPTIVEDLIRLNGMKGIPDETIAQVIEWQNAVTKRKDQLTAEESKLLQKAEAGEFSTLDKVLLGIAIAIPVLMGLRYGSGAFLASAGKGLEGYAGTLQKEQLADSERNAKAGKRVGEIQEERLKLEEKIVDVNKKILDSIPDKSVREFMTNKKILEFGDKVGVSTGDEKDALWFDGKQLEMSDDGIKEARKNLSDAKEKIGLLNKANVTINDGIDLMNAVKKDAGAMAALKANYGLISSLGGNVKAEMFNPVMVDMKGKDGKIRKVNVFPLLEQNSAAMQDVYNKVNLGRTAGLPEAVVAHWKNIFGDVNELGFWLSGQNMESMLEKANGLKDILNQGATEQMVASGFLREPLEKQYPPKSDKPLQSTDIVIDKIRNQPEAYRSKVK